jgi:hypothetical protein
MRMGTMTKRFRLLDDDRQPTSLLGWLMVLAMILIGASGCAPVQSAGSVAAPVVTAPVKATADTVIVEGGRGLILANLAYQTVGTAAAIAIENDWVKGDAKVKVQAASQRAVDALEAGERAVQTADKATQAAAALSAVGDLCELHPFIKAACDRAK